MGVPTNIFHIHRGRIATIVFAIFIITIACAGRDGEVIIIVIFAVSLYLSLYQFFPVRKWDLVKIWMDFIERKKPMSIAAILNKSSLK